VPDGEPDRALGGDQGLLLVDVHPPARRDRDDAGHREQRRAHEPAAVHDGRVGRDDPHDDAGGGDHQVEDTGPPPTAVVGELVRTDEPRGVEVLRQLVADVVGHDDPQATSGRAKPL
jgi:hypothetical protein